MRLEFETNVSAFAGSHAAGAESNPESASPNLLKQGIAAAQSGDRDRARQLLTDAAERSPESGEAWMWLASIAEYPEELLTCLDRVLEVEPNNSRALEWRSATTDLLANTFVQRGAAAAESGESEKALGYFDQALNHNRDCEMAWFWKASLADDEYDKVEYLRRLLSINPDHAEGQMALAEVMRTRGTARLTEAKAAAAAGDNDKAAQLLEQALELDASNVDAWMLRSHIAVDMAEKVNALEKVLSIDPANAPARASYDFLKSALSVKEEKEAAAPETVAEGPFDSFAEEDTADECATEEEVIELEGVVEDVSIAENAHFPVEEMTVTYAADPVPAETWDEVAWTDPVAEEVPNADDDAVNEVFEQAQTAYEADEQAAEELSAERKMSVEDDTHEAEPAYSAACCPFCREDNDKQVFECRGCGAVLTLSDIDALISAPNVDRGVVQRAVAEMEAETTSGGPDADRLIALGTGHFNLGNFADGIKHLQAASLTRPNDVILSGQINALVIRLAELRRQNEQKGPRPTGKHILVVDDSATVRKLIAGKLEKSGHNVVCAEDGVEGLTRLREVRPDLVLLDITMPRMDGYEVCRQIRSNPDTKDIPVVMISGKDGFFDKVRGRMAGTTAYITKPFGPETLMKALEAYLADEKEKIYLADVEEEPAVV